jgi:hypothetical protein
MHPWFKKINIVYSEKHTKNTLCGRNTYYLLLKHIKTMNFNDFPHRLWFITEKFQTIVINKLMKITDDQNKDSLYKPTYGTAVYELYNLLCVQRSNCNCPVT